MPEPGAVVGHSVGFAFDVEGLVQVAVVALVETLEAAQVSRDLIGGDGSSEQTRDCWGVVAARGNGVVPRVINVGDYVTVSDEGRLFQVAVREVAGGVVVAAYPVGYLFGETSPPEDGGLPVSEEGAAHALLACVGGAEDHGLVGYQLAEASGPGGDVGYEAFEVSQVVADRLGYADAAGLAVS
jgi:hypothetical protein